MQAAVPGFPFSAVVGQDDLRLALLLNAVTPAVGGVLVRGEKGTAKSTAVRALAALLPAVDVVPGCRFALRAGRPGPGLPGRAARPRPRPTTGRPGWSSCRSAPPRTGSSARSTWSGRSPKGCSAFEPGLLADGAPRRALRRRGQPAARPPGRPAAGRRRDGPRLRRARGRVGAARGPLPAGRHDEPGGGRAAPAAAGPLRAGGRGAPRRGTLDTRVEVVRRRIAYEADPARVRGQLVAPPRRDCAERIVAPRRPGCGSVLLPDVALRRIAAVCAAFDVDGMRADLVIARAALAHAAWRGADVVGRGGRPGGGPAGAAAPPPPRPVRRARAGRGRSSTTALRDAGSRPGPRPRRGRGGGAPPPDAGPTSPDDAPDRRRPDRPGPQWRAAAGHVPEPGRTDRRGAAGDPVPGPGAGACRASARAAPGRRSRARTEPGRVVRASDAVPRRAVDVHLPATITAAAPHQAARGRVGRRAAAAPRMTCAPPSARAGRGTWCSSSSTPPGRWPPGRGCPRSAGPCSSLLRDAYQRRDKVGLVSFRAGGAELVLPPTCSVPAAQARLTALRTGGRTPLAGGLLRARDVLRVERLRDPRRRPLLVLLTDGRATVAARAGGDPVHDACRAAALLAGDGVATVVVDCESGPGPARPRRPGGRRRRGCPGLPHRPLRGPGGRGRAGRPRSVTDGRSRRRRTACRRDSRRRCRRTG